MSRFMLDYDGKPVAETTPIVPVFAFMNNETGKQVSPDIRYENSTLALNELPPGRYGLTIDFDTNALNPIRFPGDLFYAGSLKVDHCDTCVTSTEHYTLTKIIHLTSPGDNAGRVHLWGVDCGLEHAPVAGPVAVSWDPVEKDAEYSYTVYRMSLGPDRAWSVVASGGTAATKVSIALPSSGKDEYYSLQMTAFRSGRQVGVLVSTGLCHYVIGYHFTVQ